MEQCVETGDGCDAVRAGYGRGIRRALAVIYQPRRIPDCGGCASRIVGHSLDEVVKCTVIIEDISQWGELNEVYVTYFPNHFPARSAFGADGLALGALLEIECWAIVQ